MSYARRLSFQSIVAAALLLLLGALLAPTAAAQAKPKPPKGAITIAFSATVRDVFDPNSLTGVQVGDVLTGTYSFDPTTPDTNPGPEAGDYQHSRKGYGITVNIGRFTVQTDPKNVDFLIEVRDNNGGLDNYLILSRNNVSTGPAVASVRWQLDDPTQTALNSPALPTEPPVLSSWRDSFGFDVRGPERSFIIQADVTEVRKL